MTAILQQCVCPAVLESTAPALYLQWTAFHAQQDDSIRTPVQTVQTPAVNVRQGNMLNLQPLCVVSAHPVKPMKTLIQPRHAQTALLARTPAVAIQRVASVSQARSTAMGMLRLRAQLAWQVSTGLRVVIRASVGALSVLQVARIWI